jgi:RNA-directed DNA polymerase
MSDVTSTKPYCIAKRMVWEAYQLVRANRGAAGVDEETIAMFEQNLSGNLPLLNLEWVGLAGQGRA